MLTSLPPVLAHSVALGFRLGSISFWQIAWLSYQEAGTFSSSLGWAPLPLSLHLWLCHSGQILKIGSLVHSPWLGLAESPQWMTITIPLPPNLVFEYGLILLKKLPS